MFYQFPPGKNMTVDSQWVALDKTAETPKQNKIKSLYMSML